LRVDDESLSSVLAEPIDLIARVLQQALECISLERLQLPQA
jgi:hypothetical protein